MGFTTDGRVHHIGIANEKDIVKFLNEHPSNELNVFLKNEFNNSTIKWEHKGGTGTKADAIVTIGDVKVPISIKNHKTGTFDWLNASANKEFVIDAAYQHLVNTLANVRKNNNSVDANRAIISQCSSDVLPYVMVRRLLTDVKLKYPRFVIINLQKKQELLLIDLGVNNDKIFTIPCPMRYERPKKANQTSRRISNSSLRVRLVLNNGINAAMGLSKANKNSSWCIKVQQDNVEQWIESQTVIKTQFAPLPLEDNVVNLGVDVVENTVTL